MAGLDGMPGCVGHHLDNLPLEAHGLGAHYSDNEGKDDGCQVLLDLHALRT